MDPELIVTALLGAAGIVGTFFAARSGHKAQRESEHLAWSRDRRAETYIDVLAHVAQTMTWVHQEVSGSRSDEEEPDVVHRDLLHAKITLYATPEVQQAWQDYTDAFTWVVDSDGAIGDQSVEGNKRDRRFLADAVSNLEHTVRRSIDEQAPASLKKGGKARKRLPPGTQG